MKALILSLLFTSISYLAFAQSYGSASTISGLPGGTSYMNLIMMDLDSSDLPEAFFDGGYSSGFCEPYELSWSGGMYYNFNDGEGDNYFALPTAETNVLSNEFPKSSSMKRIDFNKDGTIDLINLDYNGVLYLALNEVNDWTIIQLELTAEIEHYNYEDLDGDGDNDLIISNEYQQIGYYLNDGYNQFSEFIPIAIFSNDVESIALGDLNSDDRNDIICYTNSGLNLINQTDDLIFSTPLIINSEPNTSYPDLLIADINVDGFLDILSRNNYILNQNGTGFSNSLQFSDETDDVQFGDINGDGVLDYRIGNSLKINNGNGGFSTSNINSSRLKINLFDMDNDLDLDYSYLYNSGSIYIPAWGSMCNGYSISSGGIGWVRNNDNPICEDPTACNYLEKTWNPSAGICTYVGTLCNDSNQGTAQDAYDENCECVGQPAGCTDSNACNFDLLAEIDDNSCLYPSDNCPDDLTFNEECSCEEGGGCLDEASCNYDSNALHMDNSCIYPGVPCLNQYNNGILDEYCDCVIGGCLDEEACNFHQSAEYDNGSCIYEEFCNQIILNCGPEGLEIEQSANNSNANDVDNHFWIEVLGACEPYEISFIDEVAGTSCHRTTSRTYEVIDACGNTESATCSLTLTDTTPPELTTTVFGYDCIDVYQFINSEGQSVYGIPDNWIQVVGIPLNMFDANPLYESVLDYFESSNDEFTFTFMSLATNYYCSNSLEHLVIIEDACGNVGEYIIDIPTTGNLCDDPNACDYGYESPLGCESYPGYSCEYQGHSGIFTEDCICGLYGCTDSEACNFDSGATFDDSSCIVNGDSCNDLNPDTTGDIYVDCDCQGILTGCTDEAACNYNLTAEFDDGSCCYENCGCTNLNAINYSSGFCGDDGSCLYNITGVVFFDENQNGSINSADYGLPFQTITVEPQGLTLITNDNGEFNFTAISGESILTLENSTVFPNSTTPNPIEITPETSEGFILFGVSNEMPLHAVCIDLYPSGNGFLCNDWSNHNICFRNMGNVPIDGVVELEYDELFQNHSAITPIDSVDGNKVYMSFINLLPGEMYFYDIDLLTPTVDHIGEYITSHARISGYYGGDLVAYGEQELTMEIACAYDPNDKQAFPQGYTEDHWVLQETEQEFLIRFQNTGNAPAQNIRIQDTLDVNWDLNTLQVVANSHSVMTTIDAERRLIDFYFEDIQLPDSVNNEPDSHGLISYKISPLPDLPVNTVLENTAYIYFDNNDPIITNTTWTTIHECGGEADLTANFTEFCDRNEVSLESEYEHLESTNWLLNGELYSQEENILEDFTEIGVFDFQLIASNPLCSEESEIISWTIEDFDPDALSGCPGDFTCDYNVSAADLAEFLTFYGCPTNCKGDMTGDDAVGSSDLTLFLAIFGSSCE